MTASAGRPLGGALLATPIPALKTIEAAFVPTRDPVADLDFGLVAGLAAIGSVDPAVADSYDLPTPPWWNGVCDAGNYRGAKPLGASFRGVQACGPQPGRSDGRLIRFYPGAWGHYEYQCTELIFRFMYLAYGVQPYAANGDQVVNNYRPAYGGNLVKVKNGSGELPTPGDILSYVSVHTSIVTRVDVDARGNGTIGVLEQNAPNDGSATLTVTNFRIAGINNWLHRLPQ